jgi:uncharacterized SAM-binding protein YcdF (DUF218 family)
MLVGFIAILIGSLFGAAWHLFGTRPDLMYRFIIEPLESRFQPASLASPEAFTGIIALGGDDRRFVEAGRLARLYPGLKILLSEDTNIDGALIKLGGGINPSRITLETKSTSTYENAKFSAALVRPQAQERWLLVTGALHMPRAIASFRNAGFHVEPWPIYDDAASVTSVAASAIHEWVGLIAYRLLGRTAQLLPEPSPATIKIQERKVGVR